MSEAAFRIDPVFVHLIPYLRAIPNPVIVEIGVHKGTTTPWLWLSCSRPPKYYGFEPDPRNLRALGDMGLSVCPCAVSDEDGEAEFHLSGGETPGCQGREHTDSSSLRAPTRHIDAHPWCKFDTSVTVPTVRLDSAIGEPVIDLIWCDVQGAQRQVIAGGAETLARTRMLYIEVHPEPLYDGEPTFEELLALLPGWEVVERYDADVLLFNPSAKAACYLV